MREISRYPRSVSAVRRSAVLVDAAELFGLRPLVQPDKRLEQGFLAVEIDVKRALGHAGHARDLVHAGGVEAARKEDGPRAVEDLPAFAAVIGPARHRPKRRAIQREQRRTRTGSE